MIGAHHFRSAFGFKLVQAEFFYSVSRRSGWMGDTKSFNLFGGEFVDGKRLFHS